MKSTETTLRAIHARFKPKAWKAHHPGQAAIALSGAYGDRAEDPLMPRFRAPAPENRQVMPSRETRRPDPVYLVHQAASEIPRGRAQTHHPSPETP